MKTGKIQTVVAVFIKDGSLLMEQRSKERKVYPGFLMCPSGHVQEEETFDQAFKREMEEELGIKIKRTKHLFSIEDTDPHSKLSFNHNFMLIESFGGKVEVSKEATMLKWMTYKEAKKEGLVLIVEKLLNRLHNMKLI